MRLQSVTSSAVASPLWVTIAVYEEWVELTPVGG
jgi:hypothetical protein